MKYSVSHWAGRLGNNIQQIANCIMLAESLGHSVEQKLDHDIINKFVYNFGEEGQPIEGQFYNWEPTVHCEKGILEGGNQVGLSREYIYSNIRRICKEYLFPNLNLPQKETLGDDTVVMHLRSGDAFHRTFDPPINYVQNPLIFYLNLIESFDRCILVTEPDEENPILHELRKIDKVQIQSTSVANDFSTIINAQNVALSGVGTFAIAAALCSNAIQNLYTTDLLLTEHLNYSMLLNTDVTVNVMELKNYIPVYPCSWKNDTEQRKLMLDYQLPE
jgi:hypothetical protein